MRLNIYSLPLNKVALTAILVLLLWGIFCWFFGSKRWFRNSCLAMSFVALFLIFWYTVIGRTPSDRHVFVFAVKNFQEFKRELFMNGLLFLPLGLTLSVPFGLWPVIGAFILSIVIELWQYITGAGYGQGTDIICNTLGCLIGSMPYLTTILVKRQKRV